MPQIQGCSYQSSITHIHPCVHIAFLIVFCSQFWKRSFQRSLYLKHEREEAIQEFRAPELKQLLSSLCCLCTLLFFSSELPFGSLVLEGKLSEISHLKHEREGACQEFKAPDPRLQHRLSIASAHSRAHFAFSIVFCTSHSFQRFWQVAEVLAKVCTCDHSAHCQEVSCTPWGLCYCSWREWQWQ